MSSHGLLWLHFLARYHLEVLVPIWDVGMESTFTYDRLWASHRTIVAS